MRLPFRERKIKPAGRIFSALLVMLLLLCCPAASADMVNIDGVLHYYDINGRKAEKIGLDVSFYNNQIDWTAVKAQGIDFVIVRLGGRGWGSGGVLYGDRQTQIYLRGAHEAGLEVGAYFYSTAKNPAEALEEVSAALSTLNGMKLELPLFIDMEYSGNYPYGRSDTLSQGTRADIINVFCKAAEAAGYRAGLYASEGYLRYDLDSPAASQLPLWLASYTVDNQLPTYTEKYDIWQYTDSGRVGGIDGSVDMNLMF